MKVEPEIKVLKILAQTAKAIRRGADLDLVEPAGRWERDLSAKLDELEKESKRQPDLIPHAA